VTQTGSSPSSISKPKPIHGADKTY
jgi:hypothetical protein